MQQIPGRVHMDPERGQVPLTSFRLVLAEPIIGSLVAKHSAPVRVDRHAVRVVPDFAGSDHRTHFPSYRPDPPQRGRFPWSADGAPPLAGPDGHSASPSTRQTTSNPSLPAAGTVKPIMRNPLFGFSSAVGGLREYSSQAPPASSRRSMTRRRPPSSNTTLRPSSFTAARVTTAQRTAPTGDSTVSRISTEPSLESKRKARTTFDA